MGEMGRGAGKKSLRFTISFRCVCIKIVVTQNMRALDGSVGARVNELESCGCAQIEDSKPHEVFLIKISRSCAGEVIPDFL